MIKKTLLASVLILAGTLAAFADQAAYITKAHAEKAAAFLKDKKELRHYCGPCEDKGDRVESVASVEAAAVQGTTEGWWEVKVNGVGVDLAYVYFRTKGGKWKNLAMELGIKVERVSKYLPEK